MNSNTLPNGPAQWINGELERAAYTVRQAHQVIGTVAEGSHASTEQIEWVMKTQAKHTAWAFAAMVFNNTMTEKGHTEEHAHAEALKVITDAALTTRVEQSTSGVSNLQSILLLEAYRVVRSDLQSMREGI
jgi:hypothetical protein